MCCLNFKLIQNSLQKKIKTFENRYSHPLMETMQITLLIEYNLNFIVFNFFFWSKIADLLMFDDAQLSGCVILDSTPVNSLNGISASKISYSWSNQHFCFVFTSLVFSCCCCSVCLFLSFSSLNKNWEILCRTQKVHHFFLVQKFQSIWVFG